MPLPPHRPGGSPARLGQPVPAFGGPPAPGLPRTRRGVGRLSRRVGAGSSRRERRRARAGPVRTPGQGRAASQGREVEAQEPRVARLGRGARESRFRKGPRRWGRWRLAPRWGAPDSDRRGWARRCASPQDLRGSLEAGGSSALPSACAPDQRPPPPRAEGLAGRVGWTRCRRRGDRMIAPGGGPSSQPHGARRSRSTRRRRELRLGNEGSSSKARC